METYYIRGKHHTGFIRIVSINRKDNYVFTEYLDRATKFKGRREAKIFLHKLRKTLAHTLLKIVSKSELEMMEIMEI